jgi:hypothetical protein
MFKYGVYKCRLANLLLLPVLVSIKVTLSWEL